MVRLNCTQSSLYMTAIHLYDASPVESDTVTALSTYSVFVYVFRLHLHNLNMWNISMKYHHIKNIQRIIYIKN